MVDRLATAPRNRDWLVDDPAYRGGGTAVLRWAAYQSYTLGFGGRVVVATLPSDRTMKFYESQGFRATLQEKGGMIVYELESTASEDMIRRLVNRT